MPVTPTDPLIVQAAAGTGLPADVVAAQVNVESEGNQFAVSPAGAEGEFQFLPSTYDALGFVPGTEFIPTDEVQAYMKYMNQLLVWAKGDVRQALAAYNAGQRSWQAGLGYADEILANAKTGKGLTVGTHQTPTTTSGGGLLGDFDKAVAGALNLVTFGPGSLLGGGLLKSASDIAQAIAAVALPLTKFAEILDWFFHPGHWIRLLAGLGGGILVLGGVYQMSHAGGGM